MPLRSGGMETVDSRAADPTRRLARQPCHIGGMDGPATAPHAIGNFRPRAPWRGGDLQTLRNVLVRLRIDLSPWPDETLRFPMPDGTGDVLTGRLARPVQAAARPLVVLIHGLTGCEDSIHVRASARSLLRAGFPVLRLNLRGAGPTVGLCHEQYHAGRTEDFRAVLEQLPDRPARHGVAAVGYSLGGGMLLKYLGEEGRSAPLCAAAAVSVPIDLSAACSRFHRPRNWLYKRYLLGRMKKDAFRARGGLPERWREPVRRARTIRDYDAGYIAPRYGFGTVEKYYAECSAMRFPARGPGADPARPGARRSVDRTGPLRPVQLGGCAGPDPLPARQRRPCRLPRQGQPGDLARPVYRSLSVRRGLKAAGTGHIHRRHFGPGRRSAGKREGRPSFLCSRSISDSGKCGGKNRMLSRFPNLDRPFHLLKKIAVTARPRPGALRTTPCAASLFGTAATRSALPIVTQTLRRKDNNP